MKQGIINFVAKIFKIVNQTVWQLNFMKIVAKIRIIISRDHTASSVKNNKLLSAIKIISCKTDKINSRLQI
jgi:ribosomal protein L31E